MNYLSKIKLEVKPKKIAVHHYEPTNLIFLVLEFKNHTEVLELNEGLQTSFSHTDHQPIDLIDPNCPQGCLDLILDTFLASGDLVHGPFGYDTPEGARQAEAEERWDQEHERLYSRSSDFI